MLILLFHHQDNVLVLSINADSRLATGEIHDGTGSCTDLTDQWSLISEVHLKY